MRTLMSVLVTILAVTAIHAAENAAASPASAIAVVQATEGNKATGTVRFTQTGDKVRVVADFENLSPGKHGFHIHEFGDTSAKDGASAGGHFNPGGAPHAGHDAAHRHAGDLGNVDAGADGKAHLDVTIDGFSVSGANAILGRSVVIHEKTDDLATQPSGNSGPRIGVGVIGVAKSADAK
ncbi:MAG: superoxide dismutase family protein [Planctomycetes bacterium]|nr:superoxide dismutase family protein [Planctomycetota bacterium]